MSKLISLIKNDEDIVSQIIKQIIEQGLVQGKKSEILSKATRKIRDTIYFFMQHREQADGLYCKNIQGNIHEFRIQLPNSDFLLRIFFALERGKLILLTSYLFKPKSYQDKHAVYEFDQEYKVKIQESLVIFTDFQSTHQKFIYAEIVL